MPACGRPERTGATTCAPRASFGARPDEGLASSFMDDDQSVLGVRRSAVRPEPFGLSQSDRRGHLYVIGKTGTGKSTLLRNLITQDIEAGRGLAVLDPHGDLAEELLDYIPPWRDRHVVYFNPADLSHPIGLNLLESVPPDQRSVVASNIVAAFRHIWGESWGPRLEYILFNTISALLDLPQASLLGVQKMLIDERYREFVTARVQDPVVRRFWQHEFAGYDRRFVMEATSPIQNKVGQLFGAPSLRNILGQVRSGISLRFMMDEKRLLIANLSKGRLGETHSALLGALLVTEIQRAALARADAAASARTDFALYIDEFQNFLSDSVASLLSEIRKYGIALTLANQFVGQLTPAIRQAVLGNVGSLICFRVGAEDAEELTKELHPFSAESLTDLSRFEACCRLLRHGQPSEPTTIKTLPPFGQRYGRRDHLIEQSRRRFGTSRSAVEQKLSRFLEN